MLTTGGKPISAITIAFKVIQQHSFTGERFRKPNSNPWRMPEKGTTDRFNNNCTANTEGRT
jgi:hypothetical protein